MGPSKHSKPDLVAVAAEAPAASARSLKVQIQKPTSERSTPCAAQAERFIQKFSPPVTAPDSTLSGVSNSQSRKKTSKNTKPLPPKWDSFVDPLTNRTYF